MSDVRTYDYFDYHLSEHDVIASEMKIEPHVRRILASLFKSAINDHWDVARDPLLVMRRQEEYVITMRLARVPADDIVKTWASRGWDIEPFPDWTRQQLLDLFGIKP